MNELLKQADLAMYQAKAAGRNAVRFFDPEMQAVASANAALAADLRQAWRDNSLRVEYQPQVGADGRMTGVEALLRWEHPARGRVEPSQFIPSAEETSLIIPIGRWVLETACAQIAAWARRPDRQHLSIAVNVSVRQFRHPDFVDEVITCIRAAGIEPSKLKLELTESLLADGIEVTVAKMGNLKDAWASGSSLDDFGIGYSSLSYLKRLPLDELKIDREFVKDILTDANDAAIAAHHHRPGPQPRPGRDRRRRGNRRSSAPSWRSKGAYRYQGYLYCRPLPIDELEVFIQTLPDTRRTARRPEHPLRCRLRPVPRATRHCRPPPPYSPSPSARRRTAGGNAGRRLSGRCRSVPRRRTAARRPPRRSCCGSRTRCPARAQAAMRSGASVDAGLHAEREAVAERVDALDQRYRVARPAHDLQHRAEKFPLVGPRPIADLVR